MGTLFFRQFTNPPALFAECAHVSVKYDPANDTCQLFNKATFIHKNKNFFTATLFILITAKAVRPTTRRYNSVRHSSYIWRHKHLMQCSPQVPIIT